MDNPLAIENCKVTFTIVSVLEPICIFEHLQTEFVQARFGDRKWFASEFL